MNTNTTKYLKYIVCLLTLLACLPMQADQYLDELLTKAKQGDAEAQYWLGFSYFSGMNGAEENYVESAKWYRKAAEQGYKSAQYALGLAYRSGLGVSKNEKEAVKWYRKAAEQGDEDAQKELKDLDKEVVEKQRDAVEEQYNLGEKYKFGWVGVAKDEAKAVMYYRKAAEQGHMNAQYRLGGCYDLGEGVTKNENEAIKWYCKAAKQGHVEALKSFDFDYFAIGNMKENRMKLPDTVTFAEIMKWYSKAADQGHEFAKKRIIELVSLVEQEKYTTLYEAAKKLIGEIQWNNRDSNKGATEFEKAKEAFEAIANDTNAPAWHRGAAHNELGRLWLQRGGSSGNFSLATDEFKDALDIVGITEENRKIYEKNLKAAETALKNQQANEARATAQAAAARQYQQPPAGYAVQQIPVMPMPMPMGGMPMSYPSYYPTTSVGMAERQSMINGQMAQIIGQQRMQMLNTNFQIQNAAMQQQFAEQNKTLGIFTTNLSNAAKKLEDAKNSGDADAIAKAQQEYDAAESALRTYSNAQTAINQNNINFMNSMTQDAAASDRRSREIVSNAQQEADAKIQAQRAQDKQFQQDQWNQEQARLNEAAAKAAYENKQMTTGQWVETPGARDINNQTIQEASDHQNSTQP